MASNIERLNILSRNIDNIREIDKMKDEEEKETISIDVDTSKTDFTNGFDNYAFEQMGDLHDKSYEMDEDDRTPGMYKTTAPVGESSIWTKQP